MFDEYHCFIINDKNSLKFYNGGSFKNDYSKPVYQSNNGNLMGVSFDTQTISFKIGVYWVSEDQYRRLIHFLNPYEINDLSFDFDKTYRYLVKLTGRQDSTRYIVGYDGTTPMWYTEMDLKFEVQGEQVARSQLPYTFTKSGNKFTFDLTKDLKVKSDLDTPIMVSSQITWEQKSETPINSEETLGIKLVARYSVDESSKVETQLFDVVLQNFQWNSQTEETNENEGLTIKYDSEAGLLYLKGGTNREQLLTLLSTNNGRSIVKSLSINKFKIPGQFNYPAIDYSKLEFEYIVSFSKETLRQKSIITTPECYALTNLI